MATTLREIPLETHKRTQCLSHSIIYKPSALIQSTTLPYVSTHLSTHIWRTRERWTTRSKSQMFILHHLVNTSLLSKRWPCFSFMWTGWMNISCPIVLKLYCNQWNSVMKPVTGWNNQSFCVGHFTVPGVIRNTDLVRLFWKINSIINYLNVTGRFIIIHGICEPFQTL